MDPSMDKNKRDTGDGEKRTNESSGVDVPSKNVKDDHDSVDLGDESKGGKDVVVSGSDFTGDDPLKKSIDLGNITTTGSSMDQVKIKQEIVEPDDPLKERKKFQFLILPAGHASSKNEKEDDLKNILNYLETKGIIHSVLGSEWKSKYVIVCDNDSTGESDEMKTLGNLGNINGSSMELESQYSQDISQVDDFLGELVKKMKRMINAWKKMKESSKQENLTDVCSKKVTDDSKKMMNELKTEHHKTLEHVSSVVGVVSNLEDNDDVNQSADENKTEGKGKDVVVSEESQELKKQSDGHAVNDVEGKTKESDASDDLLDIQED